MQTPNKDVHFFFFSVCCIVFYCSWQFIMFDRMQRICVKRIHLVTDDCLYDQKASYIVKVFFLFSFSLCLRKSYKYKRMHGISQWLFKCNLSEVTDNGKLLERALCTGNILQHLQAERRILNLVFVFHHIDYDRYNSCQLELLRNLSRNNLRAFHHLLHSGLGLHQLATHSALLMETYLQYYLIKILKEQRGCFDQEYLLVRFS